MNERIDQLRQQVREDSSSRLFFQLGELLRKDGQLEEAAEVLRKGLEQYPRYVAAWVSFGRCLFELASYQPAEEAFNQALALDPENPIAARMLGETAMGREDWVQAIKSLKLARVFSPPDDGLEKLIDFVEQQLAAGGQLEGDRTAQVNAPGASDVSNGADVNLPDDWPPPTAETVDGPAAPVSAAPSNTELQAEPVSVSDPAGELPPEDDEDFPEPYIDDEDETEEIELGERGPKPIFGDAVAPPPLRPRLTEPINLAEHHPEPEAEPEPDDVAEPQEAMPEEGFAEPFGTTVEPPPTEPFEVFNLNDDDPFATAEPSGPLGGAGAAADVFGAPDELEEAHGFDTPDIDDEDDDSASPSRDLETQPGDVVLPAAAVAEALADEDPTADEVASEGVETAWDSRTTDVVEVEALEGAGEAIASGSIEAETPPESAASIEQTIIETEPSWARPTDGDHGGGQSLTAEADDHTAGDAVPLPTVTLARLAYEQGDLVLARRTLFSVLDAGPATPEALDLLAELDQAAETTLAEVPAVPVMEGVPTTVGTAMAGESESRARRIAGLTAWMDGVRRASRELQS